MAFSLELQRRDSLEAEAFLEAVRFYRQERGRYGAGDLLLGLEPEVGKAFETGAFPARLLLRGGFSRLFWILDPRERADGGFAAGAALSGAPQHPRVRKAAAAAVAPGECPRRCSHLKVRACADAGARGDNRRARRESGASGTNFSAKEGLAQKGPFRGRFPWKRWRGKQGVLRRVSGAAGSAYGQRGGGCNGEGRINYLIFGLGERKLG